MKTTRETTFLKSVPKRELYAEIQRLRQINTELHAEVAELRTEVHFGDLLPLGDPCALCPTGRAPITAKVCRSCADRGAAPLTRTTPEAA